MQAELTKRVITFEDIAGLTEMEAPKKRGSYQKEKMKWKKPLIEAALLFMNSNFFYFT